MADDADRAGREQEFYEFLREKSHKPVEMIFISGNCMDCGEQSTLLEGVCVDCRAAAERRARP